MTRFPFARLLLLFLGLACLRAEAANDTWLGTNSTSWSDGTSWSAGAPATTSAVFVTGTSSAIYPVLYNTNSSGTIASLNIGLGTTGTPATNPEIDISAAGFDVTGATTLTNGATLKVTSGVTALFGTNMGSGANSTTSITVNGTGSEISLGVTSGGSYFEGASDNITIENGGAFVLTGSGNFQIARNGTGSSTTTTGTLTMSGSTSSFDNTGTAGVGFGTDLGGNGTFNMSSGTFTNPNALVLGDDRGANNSGTINVSGGVFDQTGQTIIGNAGGGTTAQANGLSNSLNFTGSSTGTLAEVILGGTQAASTNSLTLATASGSPTVTLTAPGLTGTTGAITMGSGNGANGATNEVEVSGGSLTTSTNDYGIAMGNVINSTTGSNNTVLVNGGTLDAVAGSGHASVFMGAAAVGDNSTNLLEVTSGTFEAPGGVTVGIASNTGGESNTVTFSGGTTTITSGTSTAAIFNLVNGTLNLGASGSSGGTVSFDELENSSTGTINFKSGTVNTSHTVLTTALTVGDGSDAATLAMNNTSTATGHGTQTFAGLTISANATLEGVGTLTNGSNAVSNSGTIAPGAGTGGTGQLTFSSTSLTNATGSKLSFQLGGTAQGATSGGYDYLSVTGSTNTISLTNSNLVLNFTNSFQNSITNGETFTIISTADASGVTGSFANVLSGATLATADGYGSFTVTYSSGDNVILSNYMVAAVPEPPSVYLLVLGCVVMGIGHRFQRRLKAC